MNRRGYFADAEIPYTTGSEYVQTVVISQAATVIMSALNQAHAMMQQGVTSNGVIQDEDALTDVSRCIDIAIKHLNPLLNRRGPVPGSRVVWASGHEEPLYGIITRTFNTHNGVQKYVVIEDETCQTFVFTDDDFQVVI